MKCKLLIQFALVFSTNTHCCVPFFFLLKGEGLFITEKNQHGITYTACLGKPGPFDVAGDPWTSEKNVLAYWGMP